MGSHAKNRTVGRKTALGALAVGATLTGVGLTAAALDPATAVLSADTAPGAGAAIQLSGLADPVAAGSPTTVFKSLTAAPATSGVGSLTGSAVEAAAAAPHPASVAPATATGSAAPVPAAVSTGRPVHSTPVRTSTPAAAGSGQSAIRPIQPGSGTLTSWYTGKHRQVRSAPTPSVDSSSTDPLGSDPLSGLLDSGSNPLSDVFGSAGLSSLLGSVPLLGGL